MILEKKTEEKFGYLASELSAGSKKQVLVICDYCKKEYEAVNRNVLNGREFVKKDCCWECRHKKVKDVNVAKYGVENQFQRQIVKDKIVDNNINKYNNEYYTQTQEFKDKSRKTNLEKYGVENANQSKTVRDKISNTNLERYGNKCSMNSEEIRLKIESDNLEKYGVKNYLQSEEGKKKIAQTNFEKYGAANPFSDKDIQEQIRKTNLEKLGVAIKPVPKLDAKQFLIENHLMGPGSGKSFGLFFNDKLISLIQIRCKNIENKIYEISRFCTVLNTTVIGGFSKLLKFTENTIDMSELFTFIDLRYGTGEYLPKLGFKENKTFLSFKWVNHTEVLGRMKFPGDSGYKFGYAKVWDCGQKKFTKTY